MLPARSGVRACNEINGHIISLQALAIAVSLALPCAPLAAAAKNARKKTASRRHVSKNQGFSILSRPPPIVLHTRLPLSSLWCIGVSRAYTDRPGA